MHFLFLILFFFSAACSHKNPMPLSSSLTKEEKQDLQYFLQLLMFENYGAFVLFGSKPLCMMHVLDIDPEVTEDVRQKKLASMSEEERISFEERLEKCRGISCVEIDFERNPYDGWCALEKLISKFGMKDYIIRINRENDRGSQSLILANIQKTALVLAENYSLFKEAVGMDFHPLEIVFELHNPDSEFWNKVLKIENHALKGLLCGFGLKNSLFGEWNLTQHNPSVFFSKEAAQYLKNAPLLSSTKPVEFGEGSPSNFTIPLFGAVEGDNMVKKYKKEKANIEKIYKRQDIVEITLQRLAGLI